MISSKSIRQDLGLQLRILRRNKQLTMQQVADRTQISLKILDDIEFGYPRPWNYYGKLFNFYRCEIKLVKKESK